MPTLERSRERLLHHFVVERELADRLKSSTADERKSLYTDVYDELFRRVEDHPQLLAKVSPEARAAAVRRQVKLLKSLVPADGVFVEIGPGDCALSFAMCEHVAKVVAVDVSNEVTRSVAVPTNFELVISDGSSLPLPEASVDLIYSDQLMEHLHPDDADRQLKQIRKALKPGAKYICITPNRVTGPHDISRYFDTDAAVGLHLREYTIGELDELFRDTGFKRREALIGTGGVFVGVPVGLARAIEAVIESAPKSWRRKAKRVGLVRRLYNVLLGVRLVAVAS